MQCEEFNFILNQYLCSLMFFAEQNPYLFIGLMGLAVVIASLCLISPKRIICLVKGHDGLVMDNVINKIWKCKRCGKWDYWKGQK